jgi:polysaccharide biosynthesis/export protein
MSNTNRWILRSCQCIWALALMWYGAGAAAQTIPDYTLHPGDQLDIAVWKEPDLTRTTLVRPDGKFSFPLAGEINAIGRSVAQVQQEIENKLKKYIPEPVVTVTLKEVDGNRVYVIGQVQKPGAVGMNPTINVLQSLSIAGGLTPFAAANEIIVIRTAGAGSEQRVFRFRYGEVNRGNNLQQNIQLVAGDVVVVP